MGAGFRRVVRRVSFGVGVLLIGIALTAMLANQFRVVHLRQPGISADRRIYLERGVVRYVHLTGSVRVAAPATPPAPGSINPASFSSTGPWSATVVPRFSRRDAAFSPYEWLPRHTNDGSAWTVSVPWWLLLVPGGLMACAGLWGVRTPRGHCRKCEYDLAGLPAGASVCPECGAKLPAASAPSAASSCASSTSAHA